MKCRRKTDNSEVHNSWGSLHGGPVESFVFTRAVSMVQGESPCLLLSVLPRLISCLREVGWSVHDEFRPPSFRLVKSMVYRTRWPGLQSGLHHPQRVVERTTVCWLLWFLLSSSTLWELWKAASPTWSHKTFYHFGFITLHRVLPYFLDYKMHRIIRHT